MLILEKTVFRTDAQQEAAQGSDAYFLSSADRVHFFLEAGATEETTGNLTVPKLEALNKVCQYIDGPLLIRALLLSFFLRGYALTTLLLFSFSHSVVPTPLNLSPTVS